MAATDHPPTTDWSALLLAVVVLALWGTGCVVWCFGFMFAGQFPAPDPDPTPPPVWPLWAGLAAGSALILSTVPLAWWRGVRHRGLLALPLAPLAFLLFMTFA